MSYQRTPSGLDPYARQSPIATDRGYLAETLSAHLMPTTTVLGTPGRIEGVKIQLPVGGVVTYIVMNVHTAGSTLTSGQCFAALFTGAGVLIAQTADQAVPWVSTGLKTMALAGGPFTLAAGGYYIGFWYNGTTGPAFPRGGLSGNASLVNAGFAAPNLLSWTANTGLTTTAPSNLGTQTASTPIWWAALS